MSTRRDSDSFRSHPFSHQKRIKQEKKEQIIIEQRGAFDKFLCKIKSLIPVIIEYIKRIKCNLQ